MEQFVGQCMVEMEKKKGLSSPFWNSLFNITSERVFLIDTKGVILFTNKGLYNLSGKDVVGKSLFLAIPNTYSIILKNKLEEANYLKTSIKFESVFQTEEGQKNLEIVVDPVYDNLQQLVGYSVASTDTSEMKAALRLYNYKSNLEKLFLTISTKFISLQPDKIDEGIYESLELISRFTHSEHAYIVLFNKSEKVGYQWHGAFANEAPFCSLATVRTLLKKAVNEIKDNKPLLIPPYHEKFGLNNSCPILVNPMMLEGKQYGALVLVGKINAKKNWSENFAKPMMLFSNVFINTMERKKNAQIESKRKEALEKAIRERTIAIEQQKDKLVVQAKELARAEALVRQINNKLQKSNTQLEQTVEERTSCLQKTNQELDRFVYSVSHDIKAPLASVKGLVNLVRMSPKEDLNKSLGLMDKSIDKLNGFLGDILVHSRNSRVDLKHDLIDFEKEIELAVESLRHMENADQVKLITAINQKLEGVTDQYRLQSVLKNLISNAVKYHNPDSKKSWVKVNVVTTKELIQIKVSDNGIGIDDDKVEKVFDMFYRASENSFGSGLGLYIVKETIEKLGGTITVASKNNVGTTVSLNIPNLA